MKFFASILNHYLFAIRTMQINGLFYSYSAKNCILGNSTYSGIKAGSISKKFILSDQDFKTFIGFLHG